jgi:hypothetical protein
MSEEKPRITITAERHDRLLAAEAWENEARPLFLDMCDKAMRLIAAYERRGVAARRLAGIHKKRGQEWAEHFEKCRRGAGLGRGV